MSGRSGGPGEPRRPRLPGVRRDRHGRGLRGTLAPRGTPLAKSRAARFDDLVVAAVDRLDDHWQEQLAKVEFAVEDVPSLDDWDRPWVPLARTYTGVGALPTRIVVFRRPIETRAAAPTVLRQLIEDVVVEQVAELFAVDPEDVDPDYGDSAP